MKHLNVVLAAVALSGFAMATLVAEDTPKKEEGKAGAVAEFLDAKGEKIGTAELKEGGNGVEIKLDLSGLAPGKHAFHIHAAGKCEGPDFKSAGGHFNPTGKKHGKKNPEGAHLGDLGNIEVAQDGKCNCVVKAEGVTLGAGQNSLLEGEGTTLMIHEKEDDETTDPAGNAGARIACAVIKKAEGEKK